MLANWLAGQTMVEQLAIGHPTGVPHTNTFVHHSTPADSQNRSSKNYFFYGKLSNTVTVTPENFVIL
jgi:hypothetical protein